MDYKKILKGIVDIINTTEKSDIGFANICSYIGENCPELKESEDEKIRKELITHCRNTRCVTEEGAERIAKWIAWLEKQGEQKPADTDNKFIRMRETKPKDISEFLDRLTTVEQEFLWEHIAKIRELDKEKQKTTWGEEDEEQVSIITNIVKAHCGKLIDCRSNLSWLESLKNRVIPQPKEWGETDEKCIRLCTDIINSALRAGFCVQLDRDRCIDWLQSLKQRVDWKPTREQIVALRWVLNNIPYNKHKEEISGLLDQIKDL